MSTYQEKAKECKCCGKHVPLPTVLKEYNGIVYVQLHSLM
jgi:hypothetical protein